MPNSTLNVRALQAFVAVYEEQSFSRAAEREAATQSGMSTQVKNLEIRLGATLLSRERQKFTLTPEGAVLYREAQGILKSLMAAEKAVKAMNGTVTGLIRFGMIPALTRAALLPAFRDFQQRYPAVELSLVEEYSHSLMRRVLDGELDFAIVPAAELPAGLTGVHVGRDREMLVSSSKHGLGYEHLSAVPLSALHGSKLIVPSPVNVRRKRLDTIFDTYGIRPSKKLAMDGMLATLQMIADSNWIAILPSALCHSDKSGATRTLNVIDEPPINIDYIIVEKTEKPADQAAKLLVACLTAHISVILHDWDDQEPVAMPDWNALSN